MRKLLLAGVATLALQGAASADLTITTEPILAACSSGLTAADVNRDGWISRAEAEASFRATYELLDGDADGAVTASEFAGCKAGSGMRTTTSRIGVLPADHPVFAADTDGSGAIDRNEWAAAAERQLDAMPTNGGLANPYIFDAAMMGFAAPAAMSDSNGDGSIGTLEAANAVMAGFELADANHNGRVTVAEFSTRDAVATTQDAGGDSASLSQHLVAIWQRMDVNGDGVVTYAEYRAFGDARFVLAAQTAGSDPDVAVPTAVIDQLPPL